MPDRVVRFTEAFFDRLAELLPEERPGDGTPSMTDFLLFDIPAVRDQLAADCESSTLPTAEPDVRVYVGSGLMVPRFALFAVVADNAVAVIWIDVE